MRSPSPSRPRRRTRLRGVGTDPLPPPVQRQTALRFVSRQGGVTDEPEVGFEPDVGQGVDQTRDPAGNAARTRVRIGALEAENVKGPTALESYHGRFGFLRNAGVGAHDAHAIKVNRTEDCVKLM